MKRSIVSVCGTIALALFVAGCGGSGGGGSTTGTEQAPAVSSTPTAISTTDSGAKAALSGVAVSEGGYDMGSSSSSFSAIAIGGPVGLAKQTSAAAGATRINQWMQRLADNAAPLNAAIDWNKTTAKTVAAVAPVDMSSVCTTGTATITSTESTATIVYDKCRVGSIEQNGTITGTAGSSTSTTVNASYSFGTASAPFTTTFYADPTSSVKESEDRSILTITGFTADTATGAFSATLNGTYTEEDFVLKTKSELTIANFKNTYSYTGNIYSVNITGGSFVEKEYSLVNGVYSLDSTQGMSYQNFRVDRDSSTQTYSVNGTFAIKSSPATCIDGTFTIRTTTPINDSHTAGAMTVNDNTTITFSSTGVTVAVTGQPTRTYASFAELNGVCTDLSI